MAIIGRTKRISEVTRRDITEIFSAKDISWYGRLEETEFLSRLYDLDEISSNDGRFDNAESDIWQHRVINSDWEEDWIFFDERFKLGNEDDDQFLLKFLCETLHPVVRSDIVETQMLMESYNKFLAPDGWQIFESSQISGRPVFSFVPIPINKHLFNLNMS